LQEEWSPHDKEIPPELISMINEAWKEMLVQDAFNNMPHRLPDTTAYFMDNCTRFLTRTYCPTNEDILNLRTVTQTVSDTAFDFKSTKMHVLCF
jgi:hypothetical protein